MMRKKEPAFLITFHTTADAMAMEQFCKSRGLPGRLLPVPRSVTSDCGIAWSMPPSYREEMERLIEAEKLEISATYEIEM